MAMISTRLALTHRAPGDAVVDRVFRAAESVAIFTIAGVYASTLGFGIGFASLLATVVVVGVWVMRRRTRLGSEAVLTAASSEKSYEFGALVSLLLLSLIVAVTLPNDVNNTDPAKQVASIEQATYYETLLTPGFYSDRGTKYDGWTFLHAAAAWAIPVPPITLVRYSKLLLLPCLVLSLYALVRLLDLGGVHVWAAIGLAIVFSGDSFRVISFGGPRSWAYVFQILGLVSLLAAVNNVKISSAAVARAAVFLGASAIMHLFFALANALIVAIVCTMAVGSRDRHRLIPVALILGAVFAITAAPYGYVKSGQAPTAGGDAGVLAPDWLPQRLAMPVDAAPPTERPTVAFKQLIALRWGEYGSLIPLFLAPLFWVGRRRPRKAIGVYLTLFAIPCAAIVIPLIRNFVIDILTPGRVFRIVPLSPAVAAVAVYASAIHAVTDSRTRAGRLAAALVLVASAAALIPSARSTAEWYAKVYATTVPAGTDDHPYISVGSLLSFGTEDWPPVLASSPLIALRIAAVTNRPIAFYSDGQRRWATRTDTAVDPDQSRPIAWEFVVTNLADRYPAEAPCAERLYRDHSLVLCATRLGQAAWSYPGMYQRSPPPANGGVIPDA
jgi:hypothetical protein